MRVLSLIPRLGGVILLDLIVGLVPVVGQVIASWAILREDFRFRWRIFWIAVVWILPYVGPAVYLLFGRRNGRLRSWFLLTGVLVLMLTMQMARAVL